MISVVTYRTVTGDSLNDRTSVFALDLRRLGRTHTISGLPVCIGLSRARSPVARLGRSEVQPPESFDYDPRPGRKVVRVSLNGE